MATDLGVQEQRGSTDMNRLNGFCSKETSLFGDDAAITPKMRKPYTITKQRERWTEEEHNKFLDGLQMYGRAWRNIEEHIGTKTAVQIRSHAQKFFSKVRDANVKVIDIPPPRPKRKPTHPYPRKQVNSPRKVLPVLEELERSFSSVFSASEQENRSPTSVLSAVGSDVLFSYKTNRCTSDVGSSEHKSGIQSPAIFKDSHLSLGLTYTKQTTVDSTEMEVDLSAAERHNSKKPSSVPTLKLLGTTVVLNDSSKPSSTSSSSGNVAHWSSMNARTQSQGTDLDAKNPTEVVSKEGMDVCFPMSTWPGGFLPMVYCLPSQGDADNSAAEARSVPLPWWALYGNLPLPFSQHQQNFSSEEDLNQSNVQDEFPGTGPIAVSEAENVFDSEKGDQNSTLSHLKAGEDAKCSRGFVPYKRCVV